jgi:hypothetical protein
MDIITKFNEGDRAYYNINATATIYPVIIKGICLKNNTPYYDIKRIDKDLLLENIKETEIYTFTEAKSALVLYLQTKLAEVNGLVAP